MYHLESFSDGQYLDDLYIANVNKEEDENLSLHIQMCDKLITINSMIIESK